jgi:hypothetical protein
MYNTCHVTALLNISYVIISASWATYVVDVQLHVTSTYWSWVRLPVLLTWHPSKTMASLPCDLVIIFPIIYFIFYTLVSVCRIQCDLHGLSNLHFEFYWSLLNMGLSQSREPLIWILMFTWSFYMHAASSWPIYLIGLGSKILSSSY